MALYVRNTSFVFQVGADATLDNLVIRFRLAEACPLLVPYQAGNEIL